MAKLWKKLSATWRWMNAFMIYKSEPDFRSEPDLQSTDDRQRYSYQSGYGCQVRFYAYLPLVEEQRDWLEKIYRKC